MKSAFCSSRIFIVAWFTIFNLNLSAAGNTSPREHLSLDANWKFHLGDDWPNALRLDKAGASGGAAAEKIYHTPWRSPYLPPDWAVEIPVHKNSHTTPRLQTPAPQLPPN